MISRRLGRKNPTVTLNSYSHLFKRDDIEAADAMQTVCRRGGPTAPGDGK